uniref:Uncharacterized protein n=1 Tax=Pseudictyota dubia TaxID=2749911 RepID=A0A7R9W864_9STRA
MSVTTTTIEMTDKAPVKEVVPSAATSNDDETIMIRSGVTAAVLGFLLGGPLLSALLGFTTAYASQKKNDDRAGHYARSLGDFGVSVKDRALALDAKYRIAERSSEAAERAWDRAKEHDTRYNLLEKTRDATLRTWVLLVKYVQEHHLLERGVELSGRGYEFVANRVGGAGESGENSSRNTTVATEKATDAKSTSLPLGLITTLLSGWALLVKYVSEHRLLERGIDAAGRGHEYASEIIRAEKRKKNDNQNDKKED